MATWERGASEATAAASASSGASGERAARKPSYTGVVLIHGIGDEKRNETLQEALNAITYWFNHKAGLALRPQGPGRIWVNTQLTNDDNPDAKASRASVELQAPSSTVGAAGPERDTLRLEIREVWWAQSFGLPSIGTALTWAGRQFLEELRVLVPVNVRRGSGPASTALRTPARETPQATTYRPHSTTAQQTPAPAGHSEDGQRMLLLRAALWVYGGMQYLWKLFQWFALAPVVGLLILVLPLLRLLSAIPFLQAVAIRSVSNAVDYVSLHWIAPLQVFLLDYTRSSAIRQLFEREVEFFLRDEHCERIVVIAHSLGTVVAYEGLATGLMKSELQGIKKPITFICLAQALRRLWRLEGTDQHRLRYALPEHVRWLHFWARYDPVAAGPLGAGSLPRLVDWQDAEIGDPYEAVCATLERCENVDVVNTDSLFSDHTTYWKNVEQVVGPIARELVAGHPDLEELVSRHLATPGDVLRRRGDVAWRQTVAIAGGLAAAVAIFVVDAQRNFAFGKAIQEFAPNLPGLLDQLVTGGAIGKLLSNRTGNGVHDALAQLSNSVAAYPFFTAALALALLCAGIWVAARLVEAPSPFVFRSGLQATGEGWSAPFFLSLGVTFWLPLALAAMVIVLTIIFIADPNFDDSGITPLVTLSFYAWGLLIVALWLTSLFDTRRHQRWGWFAVLVLAPIILAVSIYTIDVRSLPVGDTLLVLLPYLAAGLFAGVVVQCGLIVLTVRAMRYHRWRWAIGLGLSALLLLACATGLLAFIAPALVYGVWSGPAQLAPRDGQPPRQSDRRQRMLVLATLSIVALFGAHPLIVGAATTQDGANLGVLLLTSAAALVAGVAWGLGMLDALRERRWGWLIWLPVGLVAALALFFLGLYRLFVDTSVGAIYISRPEGQVTALMGFLAGPALLMGALIYGLWAGPSRRPALVDKRRLVPIHTGVQGGSVPPIAQALPAAPAPPLTPAGGQPYAPQQPYRPEQWPAPAQTQQPWQPAPPEQPMGSGPAQPPRQPRPGNVPPGMQSGGAPGGAPQS